MSEQQVWRLVERNGPWRVCDDGRIRNAAGECPLVAAANRGNGRLDNGRAHDAAEELELDLRFAAEVVRAADTQAPRRLRGSLRALCLA